MKHNYRKMFPEPEKRLRLNEGILGWNLIGKTSFEDIDNFFNSYKNIAIDNCFNIVMLEDICLKMRITRARFLDILMSILWSRIAFSKKYGGKPYVSNVVYNINPSSHMLFKENIDDTRMTMGYNFQII